MQQSGMGVSDSSPGITTNGNCEAPSTTLISVEGNIGCGKSSMLAYLKEFRTVEVYPEPVEKWQNTGGANLLTQLYQDPKRWAYLFHSYVYVTATDILQQPLGNQKHVKIIERSIDSNRFCFVELSRKLGNLAASEHLALDGLWQVAAKSAPTVDLIVYLRTDPEVSHARMAKRCRSEEDQVPLQYLQELHRCHEDWLIQKRFQDKYDLPPVMVIDANKDLSALKEVFDKQQEVLIGKKSLDQDLFI